MTAVLEEKASPAVLGDAVGDAYRRFCGSYRDLLLAVADHDRYEGFRSSGLRREEDYLTRVFDVSWPTAKGWVREARLVGAHPEIGERLAGGELSVDAFRKLAELAEAKAKEALRPKGPFDDDKPGGGGAGSGDESGGSDGGESGGGGSEPEGGDRADPEGGGDESGMSLAEFMTLWDEMNARQLGQRVARMRAEEARRRDRQRTRHLKLVRVEGEGKLLIKDAALFDVDAAIVGEAFEDYANRVGRNPDTGEWDPRDMRYADALVAMASAYLGRRERDVSHPLVVFHAQASALTSDPLAQGATGADHSPLDAATVRRLACFSKINVALDDEAGNPLLLGRTQRLASWQQEYMVIWRDGACRGCSSAVGLEIHHLDEWTAELGLTDVDRLIAACRTCHHLKHDQGWRFEGDPDGEIRLLDPGGAVRGRTQPHPRFEERPRPPRDWISDPPAEDDQHAPARSAGSSFDDDSPRLW